MLLHYDILVAANLLANYCICYHQSYLQLTVRVSEADKKSMCVSILTLVFSLPALVGA